MGFFELAMIGLGLSMDAFAVSLCKGVESRRLTAKRALTVALFFGMFQAGMPLIGWALGRQFEQFITQYDHWVAFILLSVIGGKMIYDAVRGDACCDVKDSSLCLRDLTLLAIATSVDALAVGITFAFFEMSILTAVGIIGVITFVVCLIGTVLGYQFGARYKNKAELAGGVVLTLIGLKILLEHTGFLQQIIP